MKTKIQTIGITFYTDREQYQALRENADSQNISNSEFVRKAVEEYLKKYKTVLLKQEQQI